MVRGSSASKPADAAAPVGDVDAEEDGDVVPLPVPAPAAAAEGEDDDEAPAGAHSVTALLPNSAQRNRTKLQQRGTSRSTHTRTGSTIYMSNN
jgi:hypothetical protein